MLHHLTNCPATGTLHSRCFADGAHLSDIKLINILEIFKTLYLLSTLQQCQAWKDGAGVRQFANQQMIAFEGIA